MGQTDSRLFHHSKLSVPFRSQKIKRFKASSYAIKDLIYNATTKEVDIDKLYEGACIPYNTKAGCVTSLWDNVQGVLSYGDEMFNTIGFNKNEQDEHLSELLQHFSFVRIEDNDIASVKRCLNNAQLVAAIVKLENGVCCAACLYGYNSEDILFGHVYMSPQASQNVQLDISQAACLWTITGNRNKIKHCRINQNH
jgi:hypothetical protein